MAVINIRGDIVGNDDKWIYDWFEWMPHVQRILQTQSTALQMMKK